MAQRFKKLFRPAILLIAALVAASLVYFWRYHKSVVAPMSPEGKPQTNSISHTPSVGSSLAQGGAVDNKGSTPASTPTTPQAEWVISSSGDITVQNPVNNATLKSGDTLSGLARVDTVQYRVKDNRVGVLAQGSLTVVNGKFSGTLSFKPQSSTGDLDVFSYDSSYQEINELNIPLTLEP